jgi:hypothetical protein
MSKTPSWYGHKPVLSQDHNVSNIGYAYLFSVGTLPARFVGRGERDRGRMDLALVHVERLARTPFASPNNLRTIVNLMQIDHMGESPKPQSSTRVTHSVRAIRSRCQIP